MVNHAHSFACKRQALSVARTWGIPEAGLQNFHIQLDGRANIGTDGVFCSGFLLEDWSISSLCTSTKVAIKFRLVDWYCVASRSAAVRVLHTATLLEDGQPFLDATAELAVVAASCTLQEDSVVRQVELFSGGFGGWSRASWVLNHRVRVQVPWVLDAEPLCHAPARIQHSGLSMVADLYGLRQHIASSRPFFLCAEFQASWWHAAFSIPGIKIWTVSPPCQSWSSASHGLGLDCPNGELWLDLLALAEVFQPPIICAEEVQGFRQHEHYCFLRDAWNQLGYRQVWASGLDLLDFAPSSRPRFLMVLVRQDCVPMPLARFPGPVLPKRPTLHSFKCLPSIPEPLLAPCVLNESTMAVYMDPAYVPRRSERQAQLPHAYRCRGPEDRANCFMAMYHRQHCLPESLLRSKGILACLFQADDESPPRFFSAPEIALCHTVSGPLLIPHDDELAMRFLGNSLPPVLAIVPLAIAVSFARPSAPPLDLTDMVQLCLDLRTHADNMQLLSLPEGWLLAKPEQILEMTPCYPELAWRLTPWDEGPQLRTLWLADEMRAFLLAFPTNVSVGSALSCLGVDVPSECHLDGESKARLLNTYGWTPYSDSLVLEVPALPELCPSGLRWPDWVWPAPAAGSPALFVNQPPSAAPAGAPVASADLSDVCLVLGRHACYLLPRTGPLFLFLLDLVATTEVQALPEQDGNLWPYQVVWTTTRGVPLLLPNDVKGVVLATIESGTEPPPFWPPSDLTAIGCVSPAMPTLITAVEPAELATPLAFPATTLRPLGLRVSSSRIATPHQGRQYAFVPRPLCLHLAEAHVLGHCVDLLLQGCLNFWQSRAAEPVPAIFQVEGVALWNGVLPAGLPFRAFLEVWTKAHAVLGNNKSGRIYSGPRPIPLDMTLAEAALSVSAPGFTRKTGELLITIMPTLRGGGSKDERYSQAQSGLAQLLMDRGVTLQQATEIVDRLLPAAGVPRVQRVLQLAHLDNKWEQLQALCRQFQVAIPHAEARSMKAERRVFAEAKRRAGGRPAIRARDYRIAPGFLFNEDGTAATLLRDLYPGCSGAVMLDFAEASSQIPSYLGVCHDELAVIVPGHRCPHAESCARRLTVPAHNIQGDQVLLAACLHQLGSKPVECKIQHSAEVDVPEAVCLAFHAFKDLWPSQPAWDDMVRNPVRVSLDLLAQAGLPRPFTAPWGRIFRLGTKVASPAQCDSLQFHARAPAGEVEALLQRSGHNRLFVTPKNWSHELHPAYSVVWVPGEWEAVCQLATPCPLQLGVVRVKSRYGVRVLKAKFHEAFQLLRPGEQTPAQVAVTKTFRMSQVPPGARAVDIAAWAEKLSWPVRPLRQTGPRQWLLGASAGPPAEVLSFNNQTVLIQEQPPRQPEQSALTAGRAISSNVASAASSGPAPSYLAQKTGVVEEVPPQPPDPPNKKRFDDQEARLQKLEAGLVSVQETQKLLGREVHSSAADLRNQMQQAKVDAQKFQEAFTAQLNSNIDALRQAQDVQRHQMQSSLDELKMLLTQGPRPAVKRPAMDLDG